MAANLAGGGEEGRRGGGEGGGGGGEEEEEATNSKQDFAGEMSKFTKGSRLTLTVLRFLSTLFLSSTFDSLFPEIVSW